MLEKEPHVRPREILILKLVFKDEIGSSRWSSKRGAIFKEEVLNEPNEIYREQAKRYFMSHRISFMSNGDRIKYDENGEIEEVFSSRYGLNEMPESVIKLLKECQYD
jgi:hypothetical protein